MKSLSIKQKIKRKTFYVSVSLIIFCITLLSGCSAHQLKAPCSNYGEWCSKTPINSWNDN